MADDPIEEYAQLDNKHILLQLVGARPPTGEDPVELAERNVGATERSFGRETALHAMVLNTQHPCFALMHKNQNGAAAQPHRLMRLRRAIWTASPTSKGLIVGYRTSAADSHSEQGRPPLYSGFFRMSSGHRGRQTLRGP